MKPVFTLLLFCFLMMVTQSFQCGDRGANSQCDIYNKDTVLLNVTVVNPATEYHLYDTIWLNSTVSDTYSPLSGSPASFTKSTDQLYLTIQPFSINTATSLPTLQNANIEFNAVVREGILQNPGYSGYIYQYKRLAPNNNLMAGLVAGRTGLYLIELNPGNYINNPFYIYNTGDFCTTYYGVSALPAAQQNINYWNTLGVSAMSTAPNYGSHTVSRTMRNYLIIKVVP